MCLGGYNRLVTLLVLSHFRHRLITLKSGFVAHAIRFGKANIGKSWFEVFSALNAVGITFRFVFGYLP